MNYNDVIILLKLPQNYLAYQLKMFYKVNFLTTEFNHKQLSNYY